MKNIFMNLIQEVEKKNEKNKKKKFIKFGSKVNVKDIIVFVHD